MNAITHTHKVYIDNLAEAYISVAKVNNYLVGIVGLYTADDLDEAEQVLITKSNAHNNKNRHIELALDLLAHDRKAKGH